MGLALSNGKTKNILSISRDTGPTVRGITEDNLTLDIVKKFEQELRFTAVSLEMKSQSTLANSEATENQGPFSNCTQDTYTCSAFLFSISMYA